eukprot:361241-Chlamydomonas_euryale.AAC.9
MRTWSRRMAMARPPTLILKYAEDELVSCVSCMSSVALVFECLRDAATALAASALSAMRLASASAPRRVAPMKLPPGLPECIWSTVLATD